MQPYNLDTLYNTFAKVTKDIIMFLPRTSDLNQIVKYNDREEKMQVMHYCFDGASRALCAYYGSFSQILEISEEES
jgi:trimethylguanosine synthase